MKNRWRTLLPYGLILAVDFYLLPLLIRDTGTAMLMLLCVLPLVAFGCGVLYGARHGFSLLLPLLAMLLFTPTLSIHYNATAWVYIPVYGVVVLAGNGLGRLFYRKR